MEVVCTSIGLSSGYDLWFRLTQEVSIKQWQVVNGLDSNNLPFCTEVTLCVAADLTDVLRINPLAP